MYLYFLCLRMYNKLEMIKIKKFGVFINKCELCKVVTLKIIFSKKPSYLRKSEKSEILGLV